MSKATGVFMVVAGAVFGFILSRSGAADFDVIQSMFLLEHIHLYGIIGVAVAVALPGLWLLKRSGRSIQGEPLKYKVRIPHRGNLLGGIVFGIGWAITGMCPGPIIVNIGEGKLYALAALAGALLGAYTLGALYPRMAPSLGMPPLKGEDPGGSV